MNRSKMARQKVAFDTEIGEQFSNVAELSALARVVVRVAHACSGTLLCSAERCA